jgi:hypothetical protein
MTEGIRYTKTTSDEWEKIEDKDGRSIDPIECTVDEEISV